MRGVNAAEATRGAAALSGDDAQLLPLFDAIKTFAEVPAHPPAHLGHLGHLGRLVSPVYSSAP